MLNLHRMRVLRELARHGSIAAAADALSLTPSAASQHLATLERETGVALVERGARSVRLTEAGWVLAAHTDDVLGRLADAEASIRAIAGLELGTLRLAGFAGAGAALLAPAAALFYEQWPAISLHHVEGEPEALLPALASGDLDLALVYAYDFAARDRPAGIEFVHLHDDPVHVALPSTHRLAETGAVPLAELAHETWIAGSDTTWCAAFTESACIRAGFEPSIRFRTDDYAVTCALVAAGVGVAFVPLLAAPAVPRAFAMRPLAGDSPIRRVYAAHRRGAERLPALGPMLVALADAANRLAPR